MESDPNYDYLIEDGKVICKVKKLSVNGKCMDHNDFSWRVNKKFNKIDSDKQSQLESKPHRCLGDEKQRIDRAHLKSKDLRRWGFKV